MVAGIAVMTGCADKPVEEMMQAETAIQIAQAAGADEYAAEDFSAAAAALAVPAAAQTDSTHRPRRRRHGHPPPPPPDRKSVV